MAKIKEVNKNSDQLGKENRPSSKKLVSNKKNEARFPSEFKGNMKEAMQHL